jgi:hypothetical protein
MSRIDTQNVYLCRGPDTGRFPRKRPQLPLTRMPRVPSGATSVSSRGPIMAPSGTTTLTSSGLFATPLTTSIVSRLSR